MVSRLGELAKAPFRDSLALYSAEILGRPAEYYDDYYFFRNRVFRRYAEKLPTTEKPIGKIIKTMKRMGLDASRIVVDDANRKGKNASAFCFAIKVPTDVRISYRKANPLEDFASVFHEFGHGIHFSSIDPKASFSDRYWVASGVAEIFSIFFEGLIHEKGFLTAELGLSGRRRDIMERFRFNSLFFAAFYAANSTLKLRYWHDRLSFDALDGLYADLTERFLGIRYPGAYWKLHHVMPEYILYSPSYLIAAVRALELRNALVERFGDTYWKERESGKALLELMRPGQSLDLSFSKLDEAAYVKSLSSPLPGLPSDHRESAGEASSRCRIGQAPSGLSERPATSTFLELDRVVVKRVVGSEDDPPLAHLLHRLLDLGVHRDSGSLQDDVVVSLRGVDRRLDVDAVRVAHVEHHDPDLRDTSRPARRCSRAARTADGRSGSRPVSAPCLQTRHGQHLFVGREERVD